MLKDAESTWKKPLKFAISTGKVLFHHGVASSNGKSPSELNLPAVQGFPSHRVVVLGPRTVF